MDTELADLWLEKYKKNATFSKTYTPQKGFPFSRITQARGKSIFFFISLFLIICPWANNSHVFLQSLQRGKGACSHSLKRNEPRLQAAVKKHLKTTSLPTTEDFLTLSTVGWMYIALFSSYWPLNHFTTQAHSYTGGRGCSSRAIIIHTNAHTAME